jgi:hypothetical protein
VDPKVKSICSTEGPGFWYVYIRVRGHWQQRRLVAGVGAIVGSQRRGVN